MRGCSIITSIRPQIRLKKENEKYKIRDNGVKMES